jgi:hypothetical protein
MSGLKIFIILLLLEVLAPLSTARPNEVSGVVTCVIDDDTFDIQSFGEFWLADMDCHEVSRPEGVESSIKSGRTKSSVPSRPFS